MVVGLPFFAINLAGHPGLSFFVSNLDYYLMHCIGKKIVIDFPHLNLRSMDED